MDTRPLDEITQGPACPRCEAGAKPGGRGRLLAVAAAVLATLALWASGGRRWLGAAEQPNGPQHARIGPMGNLFHIGNHYININHVARVEYIKNDPSRRVPPGSMLIIFAGSDQNYLYLTGDEARAFRQCLQERTPDLLGDPVQGDLPPPEPVAVPKS